MKISEITLYLVRLPFRFSFRHARALRRETENLIAIVKLENGVRGFGEGIPREYVTGEDAETSFQFLEENLSRGVQKISFEEKGSFLEGLDSVMENMPHSGRSAIEVACLDAFCRSHNLPLYSLFTQHRCLGAGSVPEVCYSGVISADGFLKTCGTAFFFKAYGLKEIKLKIGFKDDMDRLKLLRSILGSATDIRVDANGIWNAQEAIEKIKAMRKYGINMVEQPVGPDDLTGFKKVTEESGVKTMADESLRTLAEAETLAREKICHSFNIRLSKCGGFLNSLRIAEIAEKFGLSFQIGCHVGETGILGACGRHLAISLPNAIHIEGSYSRLLLKQDLVRENVGFQRGGSALELRGAGLGVEIQEKVLEKHVYKKSVLK